MGLPEKTPNLLQVESYLKIQTLLCLLWKTYTESCRLRRQSWQVADSDQNFFSELLAWLLPVYSWSQVQNGFHWIAPKFLPQTCKTIALSLTPCWESNEPTSSTLLSCCRHPSNSWSLLCWGTWWSFTPWVKEALLTAPHSRAVWGTVLLTALINIFQQNFYIKGLLLSPVVMEDI